MPLFVSRLSKKSKSTSYTLHVIKEKLKCKFHKVSLMNTELTHPKVRQQLVEVIVFEISAHIFSTCSA